MDIYGYLMLINLVWKEIDRLSHVCVEAVMMIQNFGVAVAPEFRGPDRHFERVNTSGQITVTSIGSPLKKGVVLPEEFQDVPLLFFWLFLKIKQIQLVPLFCLFG